MAKVNRLYFIEESVFSTEKFYSLLEVLLSDQKIEPYFAVDLEIQNDINNFLSMGLYDDAYNIQTYLYFFANRKKLEYVTTSGFLDLEDFMQKAGKYNEVYVLTQQEKVYEAFKGLKSKMPQLKIYSVRHRNLVEWRDTEKATYKAFYIEKDNYINGLDIEKIDYVYSPKYGYLKLDKNRATSGGEGICYKTYRGFFIKLYNKNHLNYVNLKKLQTMMQMDISNDFILWPLDIVYYNNNFAGYVMKELKGGINIDDMRDLGFRVGDMQPLDRYKVCLNFLKQVDYLHRKNILVGDMKPDNIMVKPPNSVYIIDSGSFQIEDYCCPVCHPSYTEKVYTGKELRQNLRTMEDEYFPINRILFEMLMLKSPFYNKNNIEVNEEGNRKFDYPMDKSKVKEFPMHIKLWFAMTQNMRDYFYYYFTQGKITYLSDWIRELELFIKQKEV